MKLLFMILTALNVIDLWLDYQYHLGATLFVLDTLAVLWCAVYTFYLWVSES